MAKARPNSPEPLVRAVSAECSASLKHPTPDLQPIRNLSFKNIEKLEITAQQMNLENDFRAEIKRITSDLETSESKTSSVRSSHSFERDTALVHLSRASTRSSYAKSTVDVNHNSHSGGFLPRTSVSSPVGPIRFDTLSQCSQGLDKAPSTESRKSSQLNYVQQCEKDEENLRTSEDKEHKLDGSTSSVSLSRLSRSPTLSNLDRGLGDHEGEADAESMDIHKKRSYNPNENGDVTDVQVSSDTDKLSLISTNDIPKDDENLFLDFDGDHHLHADKSDLTITDSSNPELNNGSQDVFFNNFETSRGNESNYPASVPKVLNLPKRLSQMPNTSLSNDRRSKVLQNLTPNARNSCSWTADDRGNSDTASLNGASGGIREDKLDTVQVQSLEKLPPQLRASAFFNQAPKPLELQANGETAVERLNYILEASARAPTDVFTNHFTSNSNNTVISGRSVKAISDEKSPHSATVTQKANHKTRRSFLFFRRKSGVDDPNNHVEDSGVDQLGDREDLESSASSTSIEEEKYFETNDNLISSTKGNQGGFDYEGAPSTLLAELQIRKQRLQKRTRTAPTAPSNGMHTTLLQLDAVAQIEKKRRVGQRTKLAWEEPDIKASNAENDEDDENVPLGVLYATNTKFAGDHERGIADWNRPLGLIQSRDLEDNEPLSARRSRLYMNGLRNTVPQSQKQFPSSQAPEIQYSSASESEDLENETLAQRMQRLRREKDSATASKDEGERKAYKVTNNDSSSNSKLEGAEEASLSPITNSAIRVSDDEGETLGQRRKRLQAKTSPGLRKPNYYGALYPRGREHEHSLKKTRSMIDLLQSQPAGGFRRVSNDELRASLAPGSLLQQNEMRQAQHSFFISEQNRRGSYGNDKLFPHSQSRTPSPSAPMQRQLSGSINNVSAFTSNPSASIFARNNVDVDSPAALKNTELVSRTAEGKRLRLATTLNTSNSELSRDCHTQHTPIGTVQLANDEYFGPSDTLQTQMRKTKARGIYEPALGTGMGLRPAKSLGVTTDFSVNPVTVDPVLDPNQRFMISQWRQSIS